MYATATKCTMNVRLAVIHSKNKCSKSNYTGMDQRTNTLTVTEYGRCRNKSGYFYHAWLNIFNHNWRSDLPVFKLLTLVPALRNSYFKMGNWQDVKTESKGLFMVCSPKRSNTDEMLPFGSEAWYEGWLWFSLNQTTILHFTAEMCFREGGLLFSTVLRPYF